MSELPPSWTNCVLGDLAEYVTSGSRDWSRYYATKGALFVRTQDINQNRLASLDDIAQVALPDSVEGKRTLIMRDDLLITITGANVGKCAHVDRAIPEAYVSQSIALVRLVDRTLARFVHRQLIAPGPDGERTLLQQSAYGLGRPVLNLDNVRNTQLYLAPLNEQKRIADKLDAVLAQVDACRKRLDRVPAILKRFRQAVLAAATSGKLTEEWRNEHGDYPWVSTTLGACGVVSGGLTKNANRQSHELKKRYLRVANVYANRLDLSDVAEIGLTKAEHAKTRLRPGDLLIVEGNGSLDQIGRVALWSGQLDDCVHQNHLIRWRSSEPASKFVLFWLLSPQGRNDLMHLASTTTGLHTLSISKVSALPIQLPPSQEQEEIVHRVEALFVYADRLEARYIAARAQIERLTPALLAKAFRGELVPQDPNDELASVLLERIRAARAASEGAAGPKRRKGGVRSKTSQKAEVLMLTRKDIQDRHLTMILKERGPLTAEVLWSASQLDIDDFYDQLKDEEARGLLREKRDATANAPRMLEAA